ncbi:hypothetical protein BBJ29_005322 [Phytophthora kernoviae]|uniref:AGC-kinase C-terminal domain-containing protein n=1 Tax=Phytophthora kernoviae TaxID=325452 RepID=A0A3F2S4J7_9STRA|nr:hypothetical protein BBJ29_005322 [Phytophthora kernoviae]RLN69587.1 hypothetical protein BBP00_00000255 [Phytophthora kernoviae]
MNKKMIKKKHAEKLCLAERKILAAISSPFVVCLKYAFQTPEELFLVLDLRTGGDLSFHLNRSRFSETQTVDWWSYGCLVYELLYGKCPFRTSKAKALHEDKQQAYDKATLELTPAYDSKYFSADAADLIQQLLIRDPTKRLGAHGADEIKRMKFFSSIDWVAMEQQQVSPPFVPDNEINAASQADIGSFDISTVKGIKISEQEQAAYSGWDYVCPETFQREAVEYLVWEIKNGPCTMGANNNSCCTIL